MSPFTMCPPDPDFLPGICIDTGFAPSGRPVVTLFHPHAHARNDGVRTAMLAIATNLHLGYGHRFPYSGQYLYDINGIWALDYGHPRDVLHFAPGPLWAQVVRGNGGALVVVSLELHPRPASERHILTGRLALRQRAPREWQRTQ
ncbi:hypothetical protein AB0N28_01040 [Streptomyces sp. NPDC051130]|uniref:hypothetical protein n=1 Tax=Streptomyces sp. NPDC051130 TaxID=3157223 RepID=UPI003439B0D5